MIKKIEKGETFIMKQTRTQICLSDFPVSLQPLLQNARIFDSSCSPEARVLHICGDTDLYLKIAASGSLKKEADMTRFFHALGLGTRVLAYETDKQDYLLTEAMRGEDCTHAAYLEDATRLCDTLAHALRELHSMPTDGCPVPDRMQEYFQTVAQNYACGIFDTDLFCGDSRFSFPSAKEALRIVEDAKSGFRSDTLLHGDYCLPNVMLDNWRLAGFIDLGNGGVGDRHIDLFWGTWTLRFNLKTDRYRERFLDAYGRDLVNDELLRAIAAAECFG